MDKLTRRRFLRGAAGGALAIATGCPPRSARGAPARRPAPYFDLPDDELVNLRSSELRFGTTVQLWKEPAWILEESRAIGFTNLRVSYPREHVEHGPNTGAFDPTCFHNPFPDATRLLREAGFEVLLTLHGHPADRKGVPQEWVRRADHTIDGRANAASFANYTRWLANHTKDFVHTYELWNEAFGSIEDQKFRASFGPGGSLQNANQYADMMLPAMAAVKSCAPHARTSIEGNYWGIEHSAMASAGFRRLLEQTDFVVYHPYGYTPRQYTREGNKAGGTGQLYAADAFYKSVNPRVEWLFSEYNVEARGIGLSPEQEVGALQAKLVLRATVLHLRHGIVRLFPFALYYPPSPTFTFIDPGRARRPVWHAMQRFMAACAARQRPVDEELVRTGLPPAARDLAIATPEGLTYVIWHETEAAQLKRDAPPLPVTVTLGAASGRRLALASSLDPISGREAPGVQVRAADGRLVVSLPVADHPRLLRLRVVG